MTLKRGDFVRVRLTGDDEWTAGMVGIVSRNGKSVGIHINGAVRGGGGLIAGFLPLLVDVATGTMTGLTGTDLYDVEMVD